ncbi:MULTISPECIES: ATP-dependent RecD-like DNA helicase [unclassified Gemella]|uniref:SF1B family DNA helicase RecD2 n=1 Tax=unclassified Gemella TaxID=2624949 RepID=UPI0010731F41|nr:MULTISPECIES: ATP-dependent RecD-like DNA helicase [unclassified Gemella]MBF0709618.1 ATP-dependent RecD-like DNA helicase [Gemella sp. GL1.1]MBF0746242.1 ATP-dependent RecD-like DNA helicase [Gemella sp. 19428wG2_WT2a]NYS26962.1 ATP-dependent RecD-like DNA helicase [Gemella sp. GL1]TFU60524.1 ATP-dependent RecD-like DNA helicase [Gemella sp. WT2a]
MIVVEGYLNKIIFHNSENNYYILSVFLHSYHSELNGDYISIVGTFHDIEFLKDELYSFKGEIVTHKKFGQQINAISAERLINKDVNSIIDYLSSDTFPGIGKKTAQLIVEKLGLNCLDIIYKNKDKLTSIKGVPSTKKELIYNNIVSNKQSQDIILKLNELGFSNKLINKIYNYYKSDTLNIINNSPYDLVKTISGVGFLTIDRIAENIGVEFNNPERIKKALIYCINEQLFSTGDTYIYEQELLYKTFNLLYKSRPIAIEKEDILLAFEDIINSQELIKIDNKIFLPSIYQAEYYIYNNVKKRISLSEKDEKINGEVLDNYIKEIETELNILYDPDQVEAIKNSINNRFSILTGGPGTGKTTIILAIIKIFQKINNYSYTDLFDEEKNIICLCAPTGKAAKRMSESTGFYASTIHKAIGWNAEIDDINEFTSDKIIKSKLVIIDETSMIDVYLMQNLLKIIDIDSKIILLGDTEQLPSVSPGNVLKDLVSSKIIPTSSLNKIFRQASNSSIIKLSHAIKNGNPIDILGNFQDREFHISDKVNLVETTLNIYKNLLSITNADKIQILIPMYKSIFGIDKFNTLIQQTFNHNTEQIEYGNCIYKIDDRVMQLENRAEDNIFNGDVGNIDSIFTEDGKQKVVINYDNNYITYEKKDLDQITLAYACSIHKSQGSEFDYVIIPLSDNYNFMYNKNLIYTAITRAKHKLFFSGNPQVFYNAINPSNIIERNSHLSNFFLDDSSGKIENTEHILTKDNLHIIDPMIGMKDVSLFDNINKD